MSHLWYNIRMELDCFETWRIAQFLGRKGLYIITNDIDTYTFVHKDELEKYGIKIEEYNDKSC